ncbi:insulin-like growth factor-binding protein complex acid labile subunit [Anthonomus grandis grandis]|uniref:insulin-like growth factor-binding protein complex acid labile subunit n=1 Tax=Anthonomus grandis grandis TaxID=2921223 RepID=UPI002166B3EF|nr:insulin-like growth factor-binding protein complex acid labile subunit [Anthonomus grandis grandis]
MHSIMIISCRCLHFPSLMVIYLLCSGAGGGTSPLCPASCTCKLSDRGKKRISCLAGGMTDPIPTGQMDPHTDILEISAPESKRNWLTVTTIFQHFNQLEELHLTQSNINQITMHAFWGLPTLKVLNLSSNNISAILDHNFRGLVNLVELNLDDNRIVALPSAVFKHLTELKVLSLQKNKLKVLQPRTFLKLVKLHVLRIGDNQFEELDPEAFKDIPELRTLECRHCGLQRINTQIYHLLPYLTHLDLGYNTIQFLYYDEFQDLKRLHTLKLDGNQFPVILENTFVNQQQLKYLCLARNRIAKIPDTALKNLTNLLELDLSFNKLYKAESVAFSHVANSLQRLDLSGNNFKLNVVKEIVDELHKVWDLGVARLKIAEVPVGLFPDRIRRLNLSGNRLEEINPEIFPKQLEFLDLSRNEIQGLNETTIAYLEGLKRVNLQENPWRCQLCHITDLFFRVNKSDLFKNATCALPRVLTGKKVANLILDEIPPCDYDGDTNDKELSYRGLIIGLISIVSLGVFSIIFVVFSCVQRHRRTAELSAKRTEAESNHVTVDQTTSLFNKEQISFQFSLDLMERKLSVSTIDEIKKDERIANGSVVTGL